MRAQLLALLVLLVGCGGAPAESTATTTSSPGSESTGGTSGGANQQGRAVAPVTEGGASTSAGGPTQADVLGRSGYGGEGYGAAPGAGGGGIGLIGGDREHPVPTCGAMESYLYVARDFQCPGGGNPLAGDPRAGAQSRIGNVGPHAHGPETDPMIDAHIVDLYEVPCPRGPVQVHVCLYHCPPGRSPMD